MPPASVPDRRRCPRLCARLDGGVLAWPTSSRAARRRRIDPERELQQGVGELRPAMGGHGRAPAKRGHGRGRARTKRGQELRPGEGAGELRQCVGRRGRAPASSDQAGPWARASSDQAGPGAAARRGRASAVRRQARASSGELRPSGGHGRRGRASRPGGTRGAGERASRAAREARAAAMVFSPTFCASYAVGHWLNLVNA
jgi:hypothetical protein